jgi:predicted transposase YdaD
MIVVYKFPQLSREEIERMLGLSELKETKVYQEAFQEGNQSLVLRLLTRRLGEISPELRSQIEGLSLEQTEALGDALLDFTELGELTNWLSAHK